MLNPYATFPTQTTAPDAAFPFGGPKNVSAPSAGDGTPWIALVLKDLWAWPQALVDLAGITPSNTPDTADVSQILGEMFAAFGAVMPSMSAAINRDMAYIERFKILGYTALGDGGDSEWTRTGGTGTPSSLNWAAGLFYDAIGREFALTSPELSFEMAGFDYANILALQVATGKTIRLQARTYALGTTSLTLSTGATILGPSPRSKAQGDPGAVFTYSGSGYAFLVPVSPVQENIRLEGFFIDCTGGTGGAIDIASGKNIYLRGLRIMAPKTTDQVTLTGLTDGQITDCVFGKCTGVGARAINAYFCSRLTLENLFFDTLSQAWTCINLSVCDNVRIEGIAHAGAIISAPIVDGGFDTFYADGQWFTSPKLDMAKGSVQLEAVGPGRGGYINRIRLAFNGTIGPGTPAAGIRVGKSSGGVLDDMYFLNTDSTGAVNWTVRDVPPADWSNVLLSDGDMLTFSTDGASSAGGVTVMVELIPYPGRI